MSLVVSQGVLYVKCCGKFIATESTVEEFDAMEREIRRLRIAHLRRMSDACLLISMQASSKLPRFPTEGQWKRFFAKHNRWSKFRTTCRAEIARLTQPR